jgi:hypothetical protein
MPEAAGLARQKNENRLRHILRERGIADLPERTRVNQPGMPLHERLERGLRLVARVGLNELPIFHGNHPFISESPLRRHPGQESNDDTLHIRSHWNVFLREFSRC